MLDGRLTVTTTTQKGNIMRIHTDTLTHADVRDAARIARVELDRFTDHNSRKRDHAYDVILSGESRRRQNGGTNYAATWDQWGVFLSILFRRDASMLTPYDADVNAFDSRTDFRFGPFGVEQGAWPMDAHGDHRFEFAGTPRELACKRCTAVQRWS